MQFPRDLLPQPPWASFAAIKRNSYWGGGGEWHVATRLDCNSPRFTDMTPTCYKTRSRPGSCCRWILCDFFVIVTTVFILREANSPKARHVVAEHQWWRASCILRKLVCYCGQVLVKCQRHPRILKTQLLDHKFTLASECRWAILMGNNGYS